MNQIGFGEILASIDVKPGRPISLKKKVNQTRPNSPSFVTDAVSEADTDRRVLEHILGIELVFPTIWQRPAIRIRGHQ